MIKPKVIKVKKDILHKNNELAATNRALLAKTGVVALNLVSSPGSGKTSLLEFTLTNLGRELKMAVIEGDQQTDNDARRIAATGVAVVQLNTQSACHLDAAMTKRAIDETDLDALDLLFIENVGNLVCPAGYDLGERMKIALLSVTEGEDKPAKYPKMFRNAEVMVITKIDLLPYLDFDMSACLDYAGRVNPDLKVFLLSTKTGEGCSAWLDFLRALVKEA